MFSSHRTSLFSHLVDPPARPVKQVAQFGCRVALPGCPRSINAKRPVPPGRLGTSGTLGCVSVVLWVVWTRLLVLASGRGVAGREGAVLAGCGALRGAWLRSTRRLSRGALMSCVLVEFGHSGRFWWSSRAGGRRRQYGARRLLRRSCGANLHRATRDQPPQRP